MPGRYWKLGNIYLWRAKTLFDGMAMAKTGYQPATLRTGRQSKFGALVWSGGIHSSFESLRNQFAAGLNMGSRGYRGGRRRISAVFMKRCIHDPKFHELLIRWFQWKGVFSGDASARQPRSADFTRTTVSGWYHRPVPYRCAERVRLRWYARCGRLRRLREENSNPISKALEETHKHNTPVMRPLFFNSRVGNKLGNHRPYCFRSYLTCPDRPVMHEGNARA